MVPPAPGLLSTTTGCFHSSLIFSATSRAETSDEPPGGKPTTNRTGLDGKSAAVWACALVSTQKIRNAKPRCSMGREVYTRLARKIAAMSETGINPERLLEVVAAV